MTAEGLLALDTEVGQGNKAIANRKVVFEDIKKTSTENIGAPAPSSARQKNLDLANQIATDSFKKQGLNTTDVQKGLDLSREITRRSTGFVEKNEDAIAKDLFFQKFGMKDTDTDVFKTWKEANNTKIQDSLYGSLAGNARELGIDLSNDTYYKGYVSRTIQKNTPKEVDESWGQKAAGVVKSLADTVVGTGAIISDGIGITDNAYKGWFGERTELTGKEGAGSKAWDLLWAQQGWVDVAFAAATALTGGLAAPAWIGARTAAGVGLKVAGKTAFKLLEKEALKEGAELLTKELFKEGLEVGTKALEKNLVGSLTEKFGSEMAEKAFKAFRSGDGIMELIKHGGEAVIEGQAKKFTGKEIAEGLVSSVTKEFGENLSAKGMSKLEKTLGKFSQMADTLHGVSTLTPAGKLMMAGSHLTDALGVPALSLVNLEAKGFKEAGKGIGGMLAKNGLKVDTSLIRIGIQGGLPFAGTLPGVGGWIQDNVMMIGNQAAGFAAKSLRIGVAAQEKQKFIDTYGIDPDTSTDVGIKAAFEDQLNYRIRHSLPSEIITGTAYKDRSAMGQATTAIIDGLANMSGLILGNHIFGKAIGISDEYLSPMSVKKNADGSMSVQNNIPFLRDFNEINLQYKNNEISAEQKSAMIDGLKEKIQSGDTSVVTTIRSVRELETLIKDTLEYVNLSETQTKFDMDYKERLTKLLETGLDNPGDAQKAVSLLQELEEKSTQYSTSLMSSDRITEIKEKQDLLISYLQKVADSTSLINQITTPAIVNMFTSSMLSPTTAALTYNKISVASQNALSKALSVIDSILEPQRKMAVLFEQKGELLKQFKNNSPYGKALETNLTENLIRNGFNAEQIQTIVSTIGKEVQMQLTKVYLSMKNSGDIMELVGPVFGDFGVKLKQALPAEKGSASGIARIIQEMRGEDVTKQQALSSTVRALMDDTMKKILDKKQDLASKYQEQAALLVALDRQKSDAIAHLNGERETLRNREVSVVPTEKLEVMSDDAAKKIAEALKESGAPADQIKSAEEGFVYTQTKPEITDDTIKTIIENTNIMKNLDEKKVEQSTVTSENQVKENKTQIEEGTNDINNAIINLYQVHETINRFIDEKRQYEDTPSSKNNDDIIRNSQQIRTSLDFINKSITNYSGLVENSIDFTKEGGVKLGDIMTFSAIRNREIQKIFKDKIATLGFDETQSPERSEQSKAAILRMANEAIGEIVKPLSMDTIRDLARNVESTDKFLNSIKEYLVNNIKFTPEYADTIVKNTFGGQETYLYNLYKNTEKQAFVRIDSNGKVEFSKDKEEPFLDANGNNTHLYRINGLGEDLIKKSNAVIVDKFMKDGKEDDLTRLSKDERTTLKTKAEELGKKVKDFSTEDIINAKLNKYIATMEKKGYEYVGSFQEEGKKHIFVPKEFGVDRFIAETFGSRVEDINKLEPKYIAIVGDNASKRGKLPFWGEITPDTESLRKNRPNRQDDNIRVLYFDDKGVIDGSDFAFQHYANTLNDTISAGEANNTWKTVSSGDKGNFIKSQTELLTAEHLSDPIFQEALTRYAEKNQEEVEGTTLKEMIDGGAFETVDGRKAIKALIEKGQLIDRMVPASSYKNIYKGIPNEALDKAGINYTRPEVGDIVDFDHKKIGVKAIDFTVTPEYAKNETVTLSNQILRGVSNFSMQAPEMRKNIDAIADHISDMKVKNMEDLRTLIKKSGMDPVGIIGEIESRFGKKMNDHNLQEFISTKNVQNFTNMLSNIMNKNVTSALTVKGNALRIAYIPQAEKVSSAINAALVEKFGKTAKDNFMILDRDVYGHIAQGELGDTRYLTIRYPVVGAKVVNAPHIIFADEIGKLLGDETFQPKMNDGVFISDKLMKRFEGDLDGDKLYMFTDPKLAKIQKNINAFADDIFNNESSAFSQETGKATKGYKSEDFKGIFREAGVKSIVSKINIGRIDKAMTVLDIFERMGLMDNSKSRVGPNGVVQAKDEYARRVGELEQKAVDGQEGATSEAMFEISRDYFSNSPKEFGITLIADGKRQNITNLKWGDTRAEEMWTQNFITHPEVKVALVAEASRIRSGDYKIITNDKGIKQILLTNPERIAAMKNIVEKYSFDTWKNNIEKTLDFIGKMDYTDGSPVPKNIENLEQSYKDSREAFQAILDNPGILRNTTAGNYLFSFIEKVAPQMEGLLHDIEASKEDMTGKINQAFTNAKQEYQNFGKFESKEQEAKAKDLLKRYASSKGKERKALLVEFTDLKKDNPNLDLSGYIINRATDYKTIPLALIPDSTKSTLSDQMTLHMAVGKVSNLEKFYGPEEVYALKAAMGKPEFENVLGDFIDKHYEFQLDYAADPMKYASYNMKVPASVKALYDAGVSPEALTNITRQINSLPKDERNDVYSSIVDIEPTHLADALKSLDDPDISEQVAIIMGYRDTVRQSAAEQALDAAKNADPLYDQKLPDC